MSTECPEFESPLCGLSNVRSQLESHAAFVLEGKYNSFGPFRATGLEQKDVVVGLQASQEETIWDSVNLGCLACGKCLKVTREVDGHFVKRHDEVNFRQS